MKVKVRLHAMLRDLLPGGAGDVEVPDGATISALCDHLGIDAELRELVTVNGTQIEDHSATLSEGDEVQVFPAVAGGGPPAHLVEGIRLFNEGDYFLAHETLEEYWIEAALEERDFYQGLIQLCVALHHHHRGNLTGTINQFRKSLRRLSRYSGVIEGVDIDAVKGFLETSIGAIENGRSFEPIRL